MNKTGYNNFKNPIAIEVKFQYLRDGKNKMVGSNEVNYSFMASVSIASYYSEMLVELKKQLLDYIHSQEYENLSKKDLHIKMINYAFSREPSNLNSIGNVYNNDYLIENKERFGDDALVLPKQFKGGKANNLINFIYKLQSFGYQF